MSRPSLRIRRWFWWWRLRHHARFGIEHCRLQVLEDGTLLVVGVDGGPVALKVTDCVFDTRHAEASFFSGNWDIDRLLESDSPVKILMRGPDDGADDELEALGDV